MKEAMKYFATRGSLNTMYGSAKSKSGLQTKLTKKFVRGPLSQRAARPATFS